MKKLFPLFLILLLAFESRADYSTYSRSAIDNFRNDIQYALSLSSDPNVPEIERANATAFLKFFVEDFQRNVLPDLPSSIEYDRYQIDLSRPGRPGSISYIVTPETYDLSSHIDNIITNGSDGLVNSINSINQILDITSYDKIPSSSFFVRNPYSPSSDNHALAISALYGSGFVSSYDVQFSTARISGTFLSVNSDLGIFVDSGGHNGGGANIPLDGGLSYLLLVGLGFGAYKMKKGKA
jgi:hypothetical protein